MDKIIATIDTPKALSTLEGLLPHGQMVPQGQDYKTNRQLIAEPDIMDSGEHLLSARHGLVVGAVDGQLIRQETEGTRIVIGKSGTRKTTGVAIPDLLTHPGSALSLEIGGGTLRKTYNYRKHVLGQNVIIIDPQNIVGMGSHSYNPLDDLNPADRGFYNRVEALASTLIADVDGNKEPHPYFRENPLALMKALVIFMKLADPSVVPYDQRNFVDLGGVFSTYPSEAWQHKIKAMKNWTGDHKNLLNYLGNYLGTAQAHDQNERSIVSSTAQWIIKWTADDNALAKYLRKSDFSMEDLRKKKTTIYIVMGSTQDYIAYQPWLRLFLQNAIDSTPNFGDFGRNFQQEDRILMEIDEMTQLGHLGVLTDGALVVRQKGIVISGIFQNYAKLIKVYGEEGAASFLSSTQALQIFNTDDEHTLEYVRKSLGGYVKIVPTISSGKNLQVSHAEQESDTHNEAKTHTKMKTTAVINTMLQQRTKSNTFSLALGENWFSSKALDTQSTESFMEQVAKGWRFTINNTDTEGRGGNEVRNAAKTNALTVGGSHAKSNADAKGDATTEGDAHLKGTADTAAASVFTSRTDQPLHIEGLDYRQIEESMTGGNQILFIRRDDEGRREYINCRKPIYHEIPLLKERADGPLVPVAPAFPEPPGRIILEVTPMAEIRPEDFRLPVDRLRWDPPSLETWQAPSKMADWTDTLKIERGKYEDAQYKLDRFDERPIVRFFRNAAVRLLSVAGAGTSCYFGARLAESGDILGGRVIAAGVAFGALMLGSAAYYSWQRYKLNRDNAQKWRAYGDARGTAFKVTMDALTAVFKTHDSNAKVIRATVDTQRELVNKNRQMRHALIHAHTTLGDRHEEHEFNQGICRNALRDLKSRVVSGWSSGDWLKYVQKLRAYHHVRNDWFDFDARDHLREPALVTPEKLGSKPPRTLHGKTAPVLKDKLETPYPEPHETQSLSEHPQAAAEARKKLEAYLNQPIKGYDLPEEVSTVRDAIERRAQIAGSTKRSDLQRVSLIDAALESLEDPHLETFHGHAKDYVSTLHVEEKDHFGNDLRKQLLESQQHVSRTLDVIRRFNGHVSGLKETQEKLHRFINRLNQTRMRVHRLAHARAIRDMKQFERDFKEQSLMLIKRGPLVPPRPRLEPPQTDSRLPAPVV